MDIFDEEVLKLWKSFYANDLEYIMVGALPPIFMGIAEPPQTWIFGSKTILQIEKN
jgi:hypothetical protein